MASPRRADFEDNRERLLEAACDLISERGHEALSVSEVARRAGLNRTTAHAHFATRTELLAAVKQRHHRLSLELLSAHKPLGEWVDHLVQTLIESPGFYRLSLHDLLDGQPANRAGWDQYIAWFREIAEEQGSPDGPAPEFMAQFLIAIVFTWPLLAGVHYEERDLPAAQQRLASEIKRLLAHGFLDPERAPELLDARGRRD